MTETRARMIRINFGEGTDPVELHLSQFQEARPDLNVDNDQELFQGLAEILDEPVTSFTGLQVYRGDHYVVGPIPEFG